MRRDGYDAVAPSEKCHRTDVGKNAIESISSRHRKGFRWLFGTVLGEVAAMWGARVVLNFQGKAMRSSQRLTKYQPRAVNRSNKSTNTAQPNPADHQRDRSRTLEININRSRHDRKMIRLSFFMIF